MARRNRVTPFGEIVAAPERDLLWMGNRGCLVGGSGRESRRHWGSRAWIICRLEWKGRRLPLMEPGRNTQLFFLDEPTALAAGHRPCHACRRQDALRFQGATAHQRTPALDGALQADRLTPVGEQRTFPATLQALPGGVMVQRRAAPAAAWLLWNGRLHRWSMAGYDLAEAAPPGEQVSVLTPRLTVEAIRAGYAPVPHPSAAA